MIKTIFLHSQLSCRAWPYWLFAALFLSTAIFMISGVVWNWNQITFASEQLPGVALGAFMILGFSTMGILLLWVMVFRPITTSRIDEDGITINAKTIPWNEIGVLFPTRMSTGFPFGNKWAISYQLRHTSFLVARRDVFMPPVSRDEYQSLIEPIAEYLSSAHPHVIVQELN